MFPTIYFNPSYFWNPYFSSTLTGVSSGQRNLSIDWLPRWVSSYYNSTILKTFLWDVGGSVGNSLNDRLNLGLVPQFFGKVSQSRQGYIAKYYLPSSLLPNVNIASTTSSSGDLTSTSVFSKTSLQSLLFENNLPCYYYDGRNIYFKNLTSVTFKVSCASGFLDLTKVFISQTPISDSPIIVKNIWNDEYWFDPELITNNKVFIAGSDGQTFTVQYLSSKIHNELLLGQTYITVDNAPISIVPFDFENNWDEYGSLNNLKRNLGEDNIHLKFRCQYSSIFDNPETLISAALGQCFGEVWNTSNSLSLVGSSIIDLKILGVNSTISITENPYSDGMGNWLLTSIPTGLLSVFVKNTIQDSSTYLVSGSTITPLTNSSLFQANREDIEVKYVSNIYSTTNSGNYITSLSRNNSGRESWFVAFSTSVKTISDFQYLEEWDWDKQYDKNFLGLNKF